MAGCATCNQRPFDGAIAHSFSFKCEDHRGLRISEPINASSRTQVLPVLRALNDDCRAFALGVIHQGKAMCYVSDRFIGSLLTGGTGVSSVLINRAEPICETGQGQIRYNALDVILPRSASACGESFARDELQRAIALGTCYDPALSEALGFPQDMQVIRWQDTVGRGLYLGVRCRTTFQVPLDSLGACINSSVDLHAARGQWSVTGSSDMRLKGAGESVFCSPGGTLSLFMFQPDAYRCINGVQGNRAPLLSNEIVPLQGIRRFAYFRCLSYNELFAVYVGIIGVLITVAMTTTTLYFTDVARPLLQAETRDWPWGTQRQSASDTESANNNQRYMREKVVLDVILRCAAALAVGGVLGMGFIYVPWRVFLDSRVCDGA